MAAESLSGNLHGPNDEIELIGDGPSGKSYSLLREDGRLSVVKCFSAMSIDRQWLEEFDTRFRAITKVHPGILPRLSSCFDNNPYYCETALVPGENGSARTAATLDSLAVWTDEPKIWLYLDDLAAASAFLHRHHVVHANLHPGNVFVTDGAESRIAITDFGQGYLGKMHVANFSKSLWFAPPEQLRYPDKLDAREGYAWDVYRFGAVAFWLINGTLPRGQTFSKQTQDRLADRNIASASLHEVDPNAFADAIDADQGCQWEKAAATEKIAAMRKVIDSCLDTDPTKRPADMREVYRQLCDIDYAAQLEDAQSRVLLERDLQKSSLLKTRAAFAVAAVVAGLSLFGVITLLVSGYQQRKNIGVLSDSVAQKQQALEKFDDRLASIQVGLKNSRAAADRFFAGLAGSSTATDGTPGQLLETALLESQAYYEALLEEIGDNPAYRVEAARARHNLAQINLKLKDPQVVSQELQAVAIVLEKLLETDEEDTAVAVDTHLRLVDCYEIISELHPVQPSEAVSEYLIKAAMNLGQARGKQAHNPVLAWRHAQIDHRLAVQLHVQRHFDLAIETHVAATKILQSIDPQDSPIAPQDRAVLLAKIQFYTAQSLNKVNRYSEAADALFASLETINDAQLAEQPEHQTLRGLCYAELGEALMLEDESDNARSILNEAVRLLVPLIEDSNTIEVDSRVDATLALSRSYRHLADIEDSAGQWTTAYRLYQSAAEHLDPLTKESIPGFVEARLTYAEMLAAIAGHLSGDDASARKHSDHSRQLADNVRRVLTIDDGGGQGLNRTRIIRVAHLFNKLGDLSSKMRDKTKAESCYTIALGEYTLLASTNSEEWLTDRLTETRSNLEQVRQ